jgi:hypothetical protein
MEKITIKLYIVSISDFYKALLNHNIWEIECLSITYDINDCFYVVISCKPRDLFWLGYLYRKS